MTWNDILGEPNFRGEIRIIKESPIPKILAKSVTEWFPERTIYLMGTSHGTWLELFQHEVEHLRRLGRL